MITIRPKPVQKLRVNAHVYHLGTDFIIVGIDGNMVELKHKKRWNKEHIFVQRKYVKPMYE